MYRRKKSEDVKHHPTYLNAICIKSANSEGLSGFGPLAVSMGKGSVVELTGTVPEGSSLLSPIGF